MDGEQNLIGRARERMSALGVDPKIAEALYLANSLEEVDRRIPNLGIMADVTQILRYASEVLYKRDECAKRKAGEALSPHAKRLGLPDDFVEWYMTKTGDYPGPVFELHYGDRVDRDARRGFMKEAEEFMLKEVRRYLES